MVGLLQILMGVIVIGVGLVVSHGLALDAITDETIPWSGISAVCVLILGLYAFGISNYNSAREFKKLLDELPTHSTKQSP